MTETHGMSHRERMIAALQHREPDRVPRYAALTPGVVDEFRRRTGEADPATYWGWDVRGVAFRPPEPRPDLVARFGRYHQARDVEWLLDWGVSDFPPEWGVATRPAHYYHLSAPLAPMVGFESVAELNEYPFPDYVGEWRHDHLEAEVARLQNAGYFVDAHVGWIFQTAWTLRSEERLFADFYDHPDFAAALLDRITAIRIAQATRLVEAGVDSISLNDDIGSQKSMIISPAMWRHWLKPRMAALISAVRRVNPAVYFRYHSDGYYVPVLDDLVEIGVSSLRTVQPESMDVFAIKRRYGAHITLEGTIGLQSELMSGTPTEVRSMIREQCRGLVAGGGWIAAPGNGVTPDVPWDNLVTLFQALDEYGVYE
jgi:uroporphyrinogen decarboxylase